MAAGEAPHSGAHYPTLDQNRLTGARFASSLTILTESQLLLIAAPN